MLFSYFVKSIGMIVRSFLSRWPKPKNERFCFPLRFLEALARLGQVHPCLRGCNGRTSSRSRVRSRP